MVYWKVVRQMILVESMKFIPNENYCKCESFANVRKQYNNITIIWKNFLKAKPL